MLSWLERKTNETPVPGWLWEFILIALGIYAYYHNQPDASTYVVGAIVIGVIRQIERNKPLN